MRVAYCEIIQPALNTGVSANRKVCFETINVKRGAVDTTDPEPFVTRFASRKRHRQIVLSSFRPARTCVQDRVRRQFVCEVVTIDDVYPLWERQSERVARGPDRLGRERVMIAWNQEDRRVRVAALPEPVCESLPKVLFRIGIVE